MAMNLVYPKDSFFFKFIKMHANWLAINLEDFKIKNILIRKVNEHIHNT